MPEYSAITPAEILPGQPVEPVLEKAKGNCEYLYGLIGGSQSNPPNGSFEVDTEGVLDNWTIETFDGGSHGIETSSPAHGAQALKFVHPGGAGNGGGWADSEYIECSSIMTMILYYIHWATAAGMYNRVVIRYYTAAKAYISDEALYGSTSNPTSPTLYCSQFTPPTNARYMVIRVVGGHSAQATGGTAYFDGLQLQPAVISYALKTVADTTGASGSLGNYDHVHIAMQDYCHAPNIYAEDEKLRLIGHSSSIADTTARIGFYNTAMITSYDYAVRWRYTTASDRPFVYAVRNSEGEIICLWACDDPPPGYWGLTKKPAGFVPPIGYRSGIPAGAEEIVLFDQNRDFVMELGEKAHKDKTLPYRVLSDTFEFDSEKKLFKSKNLLAV